MTNTATQIEAHDQLIREVFIEPIRTVVVVDDEYPTLDSLAAKEAHDKGGWDGRPDDVQRVREILRFARSKQAPWLVDVHDGKSEEQGVAPYLHHSDLLVLDYHLNGNDGSGDTAINILRSLARNDHFNLVIIYTKGYDGDLDKVVREIALGLTYPDMTLNSSTEETQLLEDAIYVSRLGR
jgi:CheY-like chemotaxis protein